MEQIPSIWDGWERQCYGVRRFADANCALGFLDDRFCSDLDLANHARFDYTEAGWAVLPRIANYIRTHYPQLKSQMTEFTYGLDNCVIAQANNVLKLTPEQFREIDRLTQLEALKPLVDSAEQSELVAVED